MKSPLPSESASTHAPFQVSVANRADVEIPERSFPDDPKFSLEEIEAAYQRALEIADVAETIASSEWVSPPSDEDHFVVESPSPVSTIDSAPSEETDADDASPTLTSRQVIEAMLFVGGNPLPGKRLAELLGGQTTPEQVDVLIKQLNQCYADQYRPYEIRLVEGGYHMQLRPEFEGVRSRAYGQGPKEIKLVQETLEVLAFVAYRQPVTREDLEATERPNISSHLRQLLRRQLIELERCPETRTEQYRTTVRFLEVFGLSKLSDLPQPMDFNFK